MVKLSKRQNQILSLLEEGKSNNDISHLLKVTEGTVKQHLYQLYKKLEVKNRTQALLKFQKIKKNNVQLPSSISKKNTPKTNQKYIWKLISTLSIIPSIDQSKNNTAVILDFNQQMNLLKNEMEIICNILDGKLFIIPGTGIILLFGFPESHADDCHRSVIAAKYILEWVRNNLTISIKCGIATLPEIYQLDSNIVFKAESFELASKLGKLSKEFCVLVNEITFQFTKSLFYYSEPNKTEDDKSTVYRILTNEMPKYENHCYFNNVIELIDIIKKHKSLVLKIINSDFTEMVLIQDLLHNKMLTDNLLSIRVSLSNLKDEENFYQNILGQMILNKNLVQINLYANFLKNKELTTFEKLKKIIKEISDKQKLTFNLVGFNSEFELNNIIKLFDANDNNRNICIITSEIKKSINNKIKIKFIPFKNKEQNESAIKTMFITKYQYNKHVSHYHNELSTILYNLNSKSLEILSRLADNKVIYLQNITDSINELLNTNLVMIKEKKLVLKNNKYKEVLKEIIFNPKIP